ncbi:MAG: glucose-6-phosphate dehydrogenase, partial [Actinomycetia bacterium]|nr:glucose-6-phosphate dehydrogenase [Actinomycetes bacterium]
GFAREGFASPQANQFVMRIDPDPAARISLQAMDAQGKKLDTITLDMDFQKEIGEAPTPYETLLLAAMAGDRNNFARQDAVEETWRVVQPLLDNPGPVYPYAEGSWGPGEADQLAEGTDPWHLPWAPAES